MRIHASSGTTGKPTVVGYTRNDIDVWADLVARSICAAGGRRGHLVHVAYGYGLFTGGLGAHYGAERARLHGHPDVGRPDREAGPADRRLRARHHHGHAELHAGDRRGVRAAGARPGRELAVDRDLRRRAVDRGDARRHRASRRPRRRRHLRAVRGDGPGRRERVRREQGRPGDLGGPLLSRDHRSRDRRRAARRQRGRARLHVADEGGAADRPLPHARPDAAVAADVARVPAHGQDRRTQRRHADHPRRERLPDPARGDRAVARAAVGAVPDRRRPRRPSRRDRAALRAAVRLRRPIATRSRAGCSNASRRSSASRRACRSCRRTRSNGR